MLRKWELASPLSSVTDNQRRSSHLWNQFHRYIGRRGLEKLTQARISSMLVAYGDAPLPRDEVLLALLDDSQTIWNAQLQQSASQQLRGEFALVELFERIVRQFDDETLMRGRLFLVTGLSGTRKPNLRAALIRLQENLRNSLVLILRQSIRSRHFQSVNTDSIAMLINCACRGMSLQWAFDPTSIDVATSMRELEQMLAHRLETPR